MFVCCSYITVRTWLDLYLVLHDPDTRPGSQQHSEQQMNAEEAAEQSPRAAARPS